MGFKDYGTHNALFFPSCNFMLFQSGESIACLNLGCGKLKGLRELMCTLNEPNGVVRLSTKRMGSACFLICL